MSFWCKPSRGSVVKIEDGDMLVRRRKTWTEVNLFFQLYLPMWSWDLLELACDPLACWVELHKVWAYGEFKECLQTKNGGVEEEHLSEVETVKLCWDSSTRKFGPWTEPTEDLE